MAQARVYRVRSLRGLAYDRGCSVAFENKGRGEGEAHLLAFYVSVSM